MPPVLSKFQRLKEEEPDSSEIEQAIRKSLRVGHLPEGCVFASRFELDTAFAALQDYKQWAFRCFHYQAHVTLPVCRLPGCGVILNTGPIGWYVCRWQPEDKFYCLAAMDENRVDSLFEREVNPAELIKPILDPLTNAQATTMLVPGLSVTWRFRLVTKEHFDRNVNRYATHVHMGECNNGGSRLPLVFFPVHDLKKMKIVQAAVAKRRSQSEASARDSVISTGVSRKKRTPRNGQDSRPSPLVTKLAADANWKSPLCTCDDAKWQLFRYLFTDGHECVCGAPQYESAQDMRESIEPDLAPASAASLASPDPKSGSTVATEGDLNKAAKATPIAAKATPIADSDMRESIEH